jgi:hypothetical protein
LLVNNLSFYFFLLDLTDNFNFFILQLILFYLVYSYIKTKNTMYLLYKLFNINLILGYLLLFFKVDVFVVFLWLIELTMIFVSLILYLFLNTKNNWFFKYDSNLNYFYILVLLLMSVLFLYKKYNSNILVNYNIIYISINYYESLYNQQLNDLLFLFISFYILNYIEFIIFGLLLLYGSILCYNIYLIYLNKVYESKSENLSLFSKYNSVFNIYFLRKQDLFFQSYRFLNIKFFKNNS